MNKCSMFRLQYEKVSTFHIAPFSVKNSKLVSPFKPHLNLNYIE